MPFLCMVRTDIPNGTLQVLDLDPNTSQRNLTLDPPGQTKYVNRVVNDTVVTSGAGPIVTTAEFEGVAAYLISHVEDTDNADIALTAARANAIALALVARMDAGASLTLTVVNNIIQISTGGATASLTGGDSTGVLTELLAILAGAPFVLASGTAVEDVGNAFVPSAGSFPAGTFRSTYESGALTISLAEGELATFTSSSFSYSETAGAALVVYNDDGTVLS